MPVDHSTMESGTTPVRQSEPAPRGLLGTIDALIIRHQYAIAVVTGVLAILGAAAIVVGFTGLSANLRALSPF